MKREKTYLTAKVILQSKSQLLKTKDLTFNRFLREQNNKILSKIPKWKKKPFQFKTRRLATGLTQQQKKFFHLD